MQDIRTTVPVEDFGATLKRSRMRRLWSLRQMAVVTGMSVNGIRQIEAGKVKPHELTVARIVKALPDIIEGAA